MKFAGSSAIIFTSLFTIFPILGLSNWNIMYLFGGCGLLALLLAGLALWHGGNIISYSITEKGIYAFKGIMFFSTFDNVVSIKKKRSLFSKRKGSVKFKLKKGLSVNYNFSNISDYETAYDLFKSQLDLRE